MYNNLKSITTRIIIFYSISLYFFNCGGTGVKNVNNINELKKAISLNQKLKNIKNDLPQKINNIIEQDGYTFESIKEGLKKQYDPENIENVMLEIDEIKGLTPKDKESIHNELKYIINTDFQKLQYEPNLDNKKNLQIVKLSNQKEETPKLSLHSSESNVQRKQTVKNKSLNDYLIRQNELIKAARPDRIKKFLTVDFENFEINNLKPIIEIATNIFLKINTYRFQNYYNTLIYVSPIYINDYTKKTTNFLLKYKKQLKFNLIKNNSEISFLDTTSIYERVQITKQMSQFYDKLELNYDQNIKFQMENQEIIEIFAQISSSFKLASVGLFSIFHDKSSLKEYETFYNLSVAIREMFMNTDECREIHRMLEEAYEKEIQIQYPELTLSQFFANLYKIEQDFLKKLFDKYRRTDNNNNLLQNINYPLDNERSKNVDTQLFRLFLSKDNIFYSFIDVINNTEFSYIFTSKFIYKNLLSYDIRDKFDGYTLLFKTSQNQIQYLEDPIFSFLYYDEKILAQSLQTKNGVFPLDLPNKTLASKFLKSNITSFNEIKCKNSSNDDFNLKFMILDHLFKESEFKLMSQDDDGKEILKALTLLYYIEKNKLKNYTKNTEGNPIDRKIKAIEYNNNNNNNNNNLDYSNERINDEKSVEQPSNSIDLSINLQEKTKSNLLNQLKKHKNKLGGKQNQRIARIKRVVDEWTTTYNSKTDKNIRAKSKRKSPKNNNTKNNEPNFRINQKKISKLEKELETEKQLLYEYNQIINKATKKIKTISQLSKLFTDSGLKNSISKPTKSSKVNRVNVDGDSKPILLENQHGQKTKHKKTEGLNIKTVLDINIKSKNIKIDKLIKQINDLKNHLKKSKPKNNSKNIQKKGGAKKKKKKKK